MSIILLIFVGGWEGSLRLNGSSFGDDFVHLVSTVCYFSMESSFPIGIVVHGTHVAVGFDQRVLSLNNIPISFLLLVLNVTGMWVVDTIFECVSRMIILKMWEILLVRLKKLYGL